MINILIIDKKRLFSEGIGVFLSKDENIKVLGLEEEPTNIEEILSNNEVQVVLINALLPSIDILDLSMKISRNYPTLKIIHYAEKINEELIIQSIVHGADSLVLERINPNHLVQSIHAIVNGATFFSEEITKILAEKFQHFELDEKVKFQRKLNQHQIHLTQREIDVAILVKKGYSNRLIAEKLQLSEGTVKNYVSELYRAFKKEGRKELIDTIQQI